jgi:hypothetical protein
LLWFVEILEIYVTGCIPKLFLVKAIMKGVRNTVDDVRFIMATTVCSVLVAVCHYECHRASKRDKERLRQLQLRDEEREF